MAWPAFARPARRAFATGDLALRLARHHRDPWRTFRGWNDVWLDPAFRSWNIVAEIADVACPVLAVQGDADAYGTMAQLDAIAAAVRGPFRELRLAGCGHAPQREREDEVSAAVVAFVTERRRDA